MKKIDKEFAKYENRIKGWACVDSKLGVVGVFETREGPELTSVMLNVMVINRKWLNLYLRSMYDNERV